MDIRMKNIRRKRMTGGIMMLLVAVLSLSAAMTGKVYGKTPQKTGKEAAVGTEKTASQTDVPSFDVERFVLPDEARMLVVVEGTEGSDCQIYVYERPEEEGDIWQLQLCVSGRLGKNGMSNDRVEGDKTTPIGVFRMDTPFGQGDSLKGFPENYIKIDKNYVWVTESNRLEASSTLDGELVGTKGYKGYYEYVLNMGYNRNAVEKKGSALFLHCQKKKRAGTSGCVEIPKKRMIEIMRLYGAHGDGACYIALAPRGTFSLIYDSFGANDGLSPEGDFTVPKP